MDTLSLTSDVKVISKAHESISGCTLTRAGKSMKASLSRQCKDGFSCLVLSDLMLDPMFQRHRERWGVSEMIQTLHVDGKMVLEIYFYCITEKIEGDYRL